MRPGSVRGAGVLAGLGVAGSVLAWLTPGPAAIADTLRHPQQAAEAAGIDTVAVSAASVACWVALLWLALALVVSAAAGLPGRCGQVAEQVAAATLPVAARRVLAIALGLSVVTATGGAAAYAATPPQQRPSASSLDLDWPVARARSTDTPPHAANRPSASAVGRPAQRSQVVVGTDDTLWSIARGHLPSGATNAQIAAAWPLWYAANRSVVGANPDLLLPGQRLVPPADPSGGQP